MTILKFVFLLTFTFGTAFSQISGEATYRVAMSDLRKVDNAPIEMNQLADEIKSRTESKVYILEFNGNQSHFFEKKMMNSEATQNKMMDGIASIIGGDTNYYNREKKISIKENIQGILIKDDHPKKDWVISTETKVIDNYTCYKAEFTETYLTFSGVKTKIIVAWFAPSLPYTYGPRGYNGLPGLILELVDSERKVALYMTNLEIKKEPTIIKFPAGKTITTDEYLKIISSEMPYIKK